MLQSMDFLCAGFVISIIPVVIMYLLFSKASDRGNDSRCSERIREGFYEKKCKIYLARDLCRKNG